MLIDTNILIAHLQGDEIVAEALINWKRAGRVLFVSSINRAEVLSRTDLSDSEIEKILIFLQNFSSVPFDDKLAELAGKLRRQYGIPLPDAGIAATALFHDIPLVTRDQRGFKKINGLNVVVV